MKSGFMPVHYVWHDNVGNGIWENDGAHLRDCF